MAGPQWNAQVVLAALALMLVAPPLTQALELTEDNPGPASPTQNDTLCLYVDFKAFETDIKTAASECNQRNTYDWNSFVLPTAAEMDTLCTCDDLMEALEDTLVPRCTIVKDSTMYTFKQVLLYAFSRCDDSDDGGAAASTSGSIPGIPVSNDDNTSGGAGDGLSGSSTATDTGGSESADTGSGSNAAMIGGIIGGAVVVALIVAFVVFKCVCRRNGGKNDSEGTNVSTTQGGTTTVNYTAMETETETAPAVAAPAVALAARASSSASTSQGSNDRSGPAVALAVRGGGSSSGPASGQSGRPSVEQRVSSGSGPNGRWTQPNGGMWENPAIIAVRVPFETVKFGDVISRGGYGMVYKGTFQGEVVAIKQLLPERRKDLAQINAFLNEVTLMSSLEHERIVRFLGVAWNSLSDLCVVSEFMDNGDLRAALVQFETEGSRSHGFDADKLKIALHVAHALTYLHSLQPVVVHRDLKSRNILLDADFNAKLTDFGVSRERADNTMTAGVGSSLWMAPEVMVGERYDEKADVFSFGVVLSELDSHRLPYAQMKEKGSDRSLPETAILQMVSLGRLSVAFSSQADPVMVALGRECVQVDPAARPTAAQVLHRVHQVQRAQAAQAV